MEQVSSTGITLRLDDETGKVFIHFEPDESRPPPTLPLVFKALAAEGFSKFFIDEAAVAQFEERCSTTSVSVTAQVGERRDGKYELHVADDLMSVYLSMTPPYGGQPINQAVLEELKQEGIVFGLLQSSLQAVLAQGRGERVLIAQGLYPVEGSSVRFESLLPEMKERRPQVDKNGIADYRNLGQIQIVHPGDLLMRRWPAQAGTDGTNVKGQAITAKPVVDAPFTANLSGVVAASGDANLLVADITGQPVKVYGGVIVNPVIEVENVDLHSGNIVFEGTVKVLGDIKAGMHVNATADVVVAGIIEAAEVKAGGDVVVTGGIVGRSPSVGAEEAAKAEARVHAGGTVSARFAENAVISADNTILVQDIALECELVAEEQILLGKAGGKHGHLVGGSASAKKLIKAMVLGSLSGTVTHLEVGQDPALYKQMASNGYAIAQLQGELKGVLQLLARILKDPAQGGGGVRAKVEHTREKLQTELNGLIAERTLLAAAIKQLEMARIEVGKEIYIGVEVKIGPKSWRAIDDWTGTAALVLFEDRICLGDTPAP